MSILDIYIYGITNSKCDLFTKQRHFFILYHFAHPLLHLYSLLYKVSLPCVTIIIILLRLLCCLYWSIPYILR